MAKRRKRHARRRSASPSHQVRVCRDARMACISARGGVKSRCKGAYTKCMRSFSAKRKAARRAQRACAREARSKFRVQMKEALKACGR